MTFFNIMLTLVIGILMLIGGLVSKKKWLTLVSFIPLAVALSQLAMLLMM
jgi:hypothetical protein